MNPFARSSIRGWLLHRPILRRTIRRSASEKITEAWKAFFSRRAQRQMFIKKKFLPHAFIELSPALIGGGVFARGRGQDSCQCHARSRRPVLPELAETVCLGRTPDSVLDGGTVWKQIPNPTDRKSPISLMTRRPHSYFMDPGGVDWNIDIPPSEDDFRGLPFPKSRPTYPRRDTVCWFALSIIEAAYRQINSLEYRRSTGRESLPRRLRNVRVTVSIGMDLRGAEPVPGPMAAGDQSFYADAV